MGDMNSAACELKTVHHHRVRGRGLMVTWQNTAGNGLELVSAPSGL